MSLQEHEVFLRASRLRGGPPGRRQRDMLFGILTKAIVAVEHEMSVPWLDDCIATTLAELKDLRNRIPNE